MKKASRRHTIKHIAMIFAYLREIGADNAVVSFNGHARLAFDYGGRRHSITVSSSPKNVDECIDRARQDVRRAIRNAAGAEG